PDRAWSPRRWESALGLAGRAASPLEALLVAPGVGVDVDDVAVLGEAVDEGAEAGGVAEDGAPLLVREVGGDDDGAGFVPLAHDAEEQVGGARVAGDVAQLVEDEQVGLGVAAESALDGGDGLVPQEIGEGAGEGGEADSVALGEGGEAEVLGEGALADAGLSAEEDVLSAHDEAEGLEELLVELAIDCAGMGPVEAVERFDGADGGVLGARREVAGIALALLQGGQLNAHFRGGELALGGVREQSAERLRGGAEAEGAERLDGVIHRRRGHRKLRGHGGSRRGRRREGRARWGARGGGVCAASRRGWRGRRSRGCPCRAAPRPLRRVRWGRRGRAACTCAR